MLNANNNDIFAVSEQENILGEDYGNDEIKHVVDMTDIKYFGKHKFRSQRRQKGIFQRKFCNIKKDSCKIIRKSYFNQNLIQTNNSDLSLSNWVWVGWSTVSHHNINNKKNLQ